MRRYTRLAQLTGVAGRRPTHSHPTGTPASDAAARLDEEMRAADKAAKARRRELKDMGAPIPKTSAWPAWGTPRWELQKRWFISLVKADDTILMTFKYKEEKAAWYNFDMYRAEYPGLRLEYDCPGEKEIQKIDREARAAARWQGGRGA